METDDGKPEKRKVTMRRKDIVCIFEKLPKSKVIIKKRFKRCDACDRTFYFFACYYVVIVAVDDGENGTISGTIGVPAGIWSPPARQPLIILVILIDFLGIK
ncbi:hypothetical protein [Geobacillus sp. E263]|uniref:hypothetical protein n=1 Tax=Geobacillus sp. E263 TaxID=391290 RepID=UPI00197B0142|nr:hypothetical protein [Geobacillus sp. E263]